jgi:hypothetical protein
MQSNKAVSEPIQYEEANELPRDELLDAAWSQVPDSVAKTFGYSSNPRV